MDAQAETQTWWVQTNDRAYGPYNDAQMIRFLAEGRVRPTTRVSHHADGPFIEARLVDELMRPNTAGFGAPAKPVLAVKETAGGLANMFVFAEIQSGAQPKFMAALEGLGVIVDLAHNFWLVRTRHSVGAVRNALSQTLAYGDRFVAVDASRDRLAWFNLGPETDVRIRDAWTTAAASDRAAV